MRTLEERLWAKVDKKESCWLWTGSLQGSGYATIRLGGRGSKFQMAHRAAYEILRGPIPDGLQLDHLCRVRHCVNPDHLEPVSGRTNLLRGTSFSAENAAKTHCAHGHEFTPENTKARRSRPGRQCRTCERRFKREYRERQRSQKSR